MRVCEVVFGELVFMGVCSSWFGVLWHANGLFGDDGRTEWGYLVCVFVFGESLFTFVRYDVDGGYVNGGRDFA